MSKTVLIVEDNDLNMKLFHDLVKSLGHRPLVAADGLGVMDLVRRDRPDLIIMDIRIPAISGIDLIQLLKGDPTLRDIPIVAVTAFAMQGDRERILASGCEAYLSKPIDRAVFLKTLRDLLA